MKFAARARRMPVGHTGGAWYFQVTAVLFCDGPNVCCQVFVRLDPGRQEWATGRDCIRLKKYNGS